MRTKETEVARPVVEWFRASGWDVYQEVRPESDGPIADIVAVRGTVTWLVEAKANRTLTVLDQALRWVGEASLVSVATPKPKRRPPVHRVTWDRVTDMLGLGYFEVDDQGRARCRRIPRLNRNLLGTDGIRTSLRDQHRTWAEAGNAQGSRWSPFQSVAVALRAAVEERPGVRLNDFVETIDHHWSNDKFAVAMLKRLLKDNAIPGLVVRNGKAYPEGFNRHTMRRHTAS